jgi:hypothetical protein
MIKIKHALEEKKEIVYQFKVIAESIKEFKLLFKNYVNALRKAGINKLIFEYGDEKEEHNYYRLGNQFRTTIYISTDFTLMQLITIVNSVKPIAIDRSKNQMMFYAHDEYIKSLNEKRNEEKINLVHEFNRLNKEVFNNELVLDFPLVWKKLKDKMGICTAYLSTGKVISITISNFYDNTEEDIINTLIHEMIHALLFQKKLFDKGKYNKVSHGFYFTQEMDRINKHFPKYHITPTEKNSQEVEQSHIGNKVLKGYILNKQIFFLVKKITTEGEQNMESKYSTIAHYMKKDQIIEHFETNYNKFFQFTQYREIPLNKLYSGFKIFLEDYNNIKIIWTKTFKPDGEVIIK